MNTDMKTKCQALKWRQMIARGETPGLEPKTNHPSPSRHRGTGEPAAGEHIGFIESFTRIFMTTEQQRIAIAEWMGYVWYRAPQDRHFPDKRYRFLALPAIQECERQIDIWKQRADGTEKIIASEPWKKAQGVDYVPNYPEDLNAMHEAEKQLTPAQLIQYTEVLCGEINLVDWGYYPGEAGIDWDEVSKLTIATAAQRSEALCRTLWPEKFQ